MGRKIIEGKKGASFQRTPEGVAVGNSDVMLTQLIIQQVGS